MGTGAIRKNVPIAVVGLAVAGLGAAAVTLGNGDAVVERGFKRAIADMDNKPTDRKPMPVVAGSEIWIRRRTAGYSLAAFGGALGLIGAGAVFSALDLSRTWCDPTHPFLQGHAIWHVLSAACLFVVFFHYRQFEKELGV